MRRAAPIAGPARRATVRQAFVALAAFALAALGLAACGGGGGSTSSSTATAASTPTRAESPATTPKSAKPTAARPAHRGRAAKPPRPLPAGTAPAAVIAASHGGGAPGFRRPGADNSIPNFGAEAPASERDRAAAALAAYLRAYARAQWGRACIYLSAKRRRSIQEAPVAPSQGRGCAAALSAGPLASSRTDPLTGGLVAFRVKGDLGFALFSGSPHNQQYDMPMESEGGEWKVTQLTPFAYPLGVAGSP